MELLNTVETAIDLSVLDGVAVVTVIGMTAGCLVVLAAGLLVGCFKAMIKIMGR